MMKERSKEALFAIGFVVVGFILMFLLWWGIIYACDLLEPHLGTTRIIMLGIVLFCLSIVTQPTWWILCVIIGIGKETEHTTVELKDLLDELEFRGKS